MTLKHRNCCRVCHSLSLVKFLDLGNMPLAGAFLSSDQVHNEKKYPLQVYFCKNCSLVQILDVIDQDTLFFNYKYLSSVTKTLHEHFLNYAKEIKSRFLKEDDLVVEIGSNDGILLQPFKDLGVNCLGVEAAANIAKIAISKGLRVINDYFTLQISDEIKRKNGKAKVICANNVFAHIDDLDDVMKGIKNLLNSDGIFVFEVHYIKDLLEKFQYDTIYHEHLCYYSLTSLKFLMNKYDMEIFDVKKIPIHSGSIRVYAKNRSNKKEIVQSSLEELMLHEKNFIYDIKIYQNFSDVIKKKRQKLQKTLEEIKEDHKKIIGYGASGRGTILLNYCNIGKNILDYVVDDSPSRQGLLIPGKHIPILSSSVIEKDNPNYILIIAWNYEKEIIAKEQEYLKKGGKFIIPFPEVKIIEN